MRDILLLSSAYAFFILVTMGHLFRHGRKPADRIGMQLIAAIFWPVYWIVFHGFGGTSEQLLQSLKPSSKIIETIWVYGIALFPVYYIGTRFNECSAFLCLDIIGKAILWAPVWPVYFLIRFTT